MIGIAAAALVIVLMLLVVLGCVARDPGPDDSEWNRSENNIG